MTKLCTLFKFRNEEAVHLKELTRANTNKTKVTEISSPTTSGLAVDYAQNIRKERQKFATSIVQ